MIVLDASAAIELFLDHSAADDIEADLRLAGPIVVPAHFEADAFAGLRRMLNTGKIRREEVLTTIADLADMAGERSPLAPLLPQASSLLDRVGAHDAFYVVLALGRDAPLLTSDGPLARAATALGVDVRYHAAEA